jgi:hypothetical protein
VRNFLAFIGLVVVGFAGAGYYFGWYKFAMTPGKDGKQHITVDVDTKKAAEDVGTGFDQGGQLIKDKLKKEEPPKDDFVGPPEPKAKNFFNMPITPPTKR